MVLKKGTLIGKGEIAALEAAKASRDRGGAARARRRLGGRRGRRDRSGSRRARACMWIGFTGRANLFAEHAGVLVVDRAASTR